MAGGHYDPAQPRDRRGEWAGGAAAPGDLSSAVSSHITGRQAGAGKKPEPDLSTREGRSAALAGADVTTPQGRALVRKVQRALDKSHEIPAAQAAANARVMFGPSGKPPARGKGGGT